MAQGSRQARTAQPHQHGRCTARVDEGRRGQGVREVQGHERARTRRASRDQSRDLRQDAERRRPGHGAHGRPLHPAGGAEVPDAMSRCRSRRSRTPVVPAASRRSCSIASASWSTTCVRARTSCRRRSTLTRRRPRSTPSTCAMRCVPAMVDLREVGDKLEVIDAAPGTGRCRPTARCCSSSRRLVLSRTTPHGPTRFQHRVGPFHLSKLIASGAARAPLTVPAATRTA